MKNRTLQWRATLLVSALIAAICIIMNLLICYTNTFYIDSIDSYIIEIENEIDTGDGAASPEEPFYLDLAQLLNSYQRGFNAKSWAITFTLTLAGGFLTYLLSGIFLRPLQDFTEEIEKIQVQNLAKPLELKDAASDIQRLADAFNAMLNRLSMAFQSQKRFIANAAHEFRTPLSIMQTKLELFQNQEHHSPEETRELLTALTAQTENLSLLIKTLLEMSEMQTVEMKDSVHLDELIDEVLWDLGDLAEKKRITLSADTVPLSMPGNDTLLYRLVFNLVENAIKYNREGGSVRVTLTRQEASILLRIQDSGIGIPKDQWEEIMKPFCRVDKSRSRAMGGVGLGLALVHEIVSLHQGEIRVEDSSNEGTVMEVSFKPSSSGSL